MHEFEAIFERALSPESGVKGKLFNEKTSGRKSLAKIPLYLFLARFLLSTFKAYSFVSTSGNEL
jgi:hypothetical protein